MKFLLLVLLLVSYVAMAGNESGGGGGAVVCRDANKQIISADLLDLFEAPFMHEVDITYSVLPYEMQVNVALEKIAAFPFEYFMIKAAIQSIKQKFKFLPQGISLNQPSDVGENTPILVRDGCALEGVGFYTKKKELLVSQAIFSKFSETDKAAFILHEAIYEIYRNHRSSLEEYTSQKSRQMVAYLFSNDALAIQAVEFYAMNISLSRNNFNGGLGIILPSEAQDEDLFDVHLKWIYSGAQQTERPERFTIIVACNPWSQGYSQLDFKGSQEIKFDMKMLKCINLSISYNHYAGDDYKPEDPSDIGYSEVYFEFSIYYKGELLKKENLKPSNETFSLVQEI